MTLLSIARVSGTHRIKKPARLRAGDRRHHRPVPIQPSTSSIAGTVLTGWRRLRDSGNACSMENRPGSGQISWEKWKRMTLGCVRRRSSSVNERPS